MLTYDEAMCSLAEQIAALADPRPRNVDREEEGVALVCDFPDEGGEGASARRSLLRSRLRNARLEDDPRYGGKTVSRRQLQEEWGDEEGWCATENSRDVKSSSISGENK